MIYRLIVAKTYEQHMFHRASLKLGLDKAVLAHAKNEAEKEAGNSTSKGADMLQAKEIDELLKRSAYDVFRDDDEEAKAFVEADIDSILNRYDEGLQGAKEDDGAGRGSFSKASFVGMSGDDDIDLEDEFWKKAVGLKLAEGEDDELGGDGFGGAGSQRRQRRVKAATTRPRPGRRAQTARGGADGERAAAAGSSSPGGRRVHGDAAAGPTPEELKAAEEAEAARASAPVGQVGQRHGPDPRHGGAGARPGIGARAHRGSVAPAAGGELLSLRSGPRVAARPVHDRRRRAAPRTGGSTGGSTRAQGAAGLRRPRTRSQRAVRSGPATRATASCGRSCASARPLGPAARGG